MRLTVGMRVIVLASFANLTLRMLFMHIHTESD
jgi:hypothetical protein